MRNFFFICLCILFVHAGYTQNTIALPEITNYSKQVYNAGTQNWKICQDSQGIVYYANNEGLLSFDGNYWKKYTVPNSTIVKGLAMGPDNRIYIGAQGEIGYFAPGKNGQLAYTSLNDLIPEKEKDFADVWDVIPFREHIFFRSNRRIFQLTNGKITVYPSINWAFLGRDSAHLIANEYNKGLLSFRQGKWVPFIKKGEIPKKAIITSITALNRDSALITTLKDGLYILSKDEITSFESPVIKQIAESNISASTLADDNTIVILTNLAGCFIINKKGELIQRLSKQDGLQNNNVLSVLVDRNRNLWFGLDNGIDFIAYNNAIKHIFPDYDEHGSGYTSIVFDNKLYIGMSNGLYMAGLTDEKDLAYVKNDFALLQNTKGQVWNLSEVNGRLMMGHTEGAFMITGQTATPLDITSGFWTFLPVSSIAPSSVMLAGTYNGVNFYNYTGEKFINPSIHSHFESARYIAVDNNIAWVAHPYKGLYRVELNGGITPRYTVYKDKKGILSKNHNHIFKIKSRVVLSTDNGIYEYNSRTDDFEPCELLQKIFGGARIPYMKEDESGNIWFVENKMLGVVEFNDDKAEITYIPELKNKIMESGFEFVYPYNIRNIFIAGQKGFYHLNYEQYKTLKVQTPIIISSVKAINKRDSTIFGGYFVNKQEKNPHINAEVPTLSFAWNSLHFDYSSPLYGREAGIEYSYYLEDFDKGWSNWSKKTEKDYTYLSPGTYTFHVKARRNEGDESVVSSYRFVILPPWYRTNWAYALYFLVLCGIAYGGYKLLKRKFILQQQHHEEEQRRLQYLNQLQQEKHEEEQKQLQYLHQLELERNANEIIKLKNEKLEAEIQLKNTELASTTMSLVQKGEMLNKVKEEFMRMKGGGENDKSSDDYKKIIKMLGDDKVKKNWDQFAVHFDKVHADFLVSLKNHYPNLTPSELKLCAYLRLNLSSKEISQVMNITIKSVELSRYRLRKKLQLAPDANLYYFLLNFHSEIHKENVKQ